MLKFKTILFRADSSSTIGTGHIMRDLVLAEQYSDSNIIFVTQELDGNINHKIEEAGYKIELLQSNNVTEFIRVVEKHDADLVVIDNYQIDYKYEQKLKEKIDVKILVFDDTYEKHHCDILLNHNISADVSRYNALVSKSCDLRCGSKYTLLRKEFLVEKNKFYKKNKKIKTIFIAMGGADHSHINIKILKVLKKFDGIKVNIVTTSANRNLDKLKEFCKCKNWIKLHINSTKIAKLMKKSNFAIVTPSVTINEIYFMNIAFIAIKTATNQQDMYEYIKKDKKLVLKRFNKNKLKEKLCKIL